MRLPHLVLAGALALAAHGVGAAGVPGDRVEGLPDDQIRACIAEIRDLQASEGHSDAHNFNLANRCPRLARALDATRDFDVVGAMEMDATSIEGLRDLQSFAGGFEPVPARSGFAPDYAGLDALLDDVFVEREVDDSLWLRFLRWLEGHLKDGESPGLARFVRWLEDLDAPPWLGDVLLKGSIVLVVLLAIIVIGNEIRLARLFRAPRPRRRTDATPRGPEDAPAARILSIEEIRRLAPREQAAAVLALVTSVLAERGWLSPGRSRTNGELVRELRARRQGLAEPFARLVATVDTVLYGDRIPDAVQEGRLVGAADALVRGVAADPAAGGRR